MKLCLIVLVLFAMLAGCGGPVPTLPAAVSTLAPATDTVSGEGMRGAAEQGAMIVALDGPATLKRAGWREYAPAFLGTVVRGGDLIRVTGSGRLMLACADLQLVTVEEGPSGLPCEPSSAQLDFVYQGTAINITRGDIPTIQVIAPRKTKVLSAQPLLRWTEAPGVEIYHVALVGTGWSTDVHGQTQLVYPPDAPALVAGKDYKLLVTADNQSTEAEAPGLGFSILPRDLADSVTEREMHIRSLKLADAPTRLLIGQLYAEQGLYAEAVQQLEAPTIAHEPAASRMLADLYLRIGLTQLAERQYAEALALSEQTGDLEGQALAEKALGDIYSQTSTNQDEALKRWQRSREVYERLGDIRMVKEIEQRAPR